MSEESNSFKFYENFLNAINLLPEGEREKACYEFCKFGITGELPEDKNLAMFCLGVSVSVQKYQGRGGYREGSGRKKSNEEENQKNQNNQKNQKNQNNHNEQTETETETKTETKTKTKTEKKEKDFYSSDFLEFYNLYPRKKAKECAFKAYKKAIERTSKGTILEGLKKYNKRILEENKEMQFIPYPASWLNGGCWEDEDDYEQQKQIEQQRFEAYEQEQKQKEKERKVIRLQEEEERREQEYQERERIRKEVEKGDEYFETFVRPKIRQLVNAHKGQEEEIKEENKQDGQAAIH